MHVFWFKKNFFFTPTELSSLNMFFSENGTDVCISTANVNLPGFQLALDVRYPKKSTGQKYTITNCNHIFEHVGFQQTRCLDEAPTSIVRCTLCNSIARE